MRRQQLPAPRDLQPSLEYYKAFASLLFLPLRTTTTKPPLCCTDAAEFFFPPLNFFIFIFYFLHSHVNARRMKYCFLFFSHFPSSPTLNSRSHGSHQFACIKNLSHAPGPANRASAYLPKMEQRRETQRALLTCARSNVVFPRTAPPSPRLKRMNWRI